MKKVQGSATTVYVYDAMGQLAAEYATQPETPLCSTCYLTADHLGSTRLMTDGATGLPKALHDYLPFGEEIPSGIGGRSATYYPPSTLAINDATTLKFTGKERDAETGLDFFLARYYSGAQGRFTSPDEFKGGPVDAFTGGQVEPPGPLPYADIANPQSLNKYAYVLNNPLRYIDPDGHCTNGKPDEKGPCAPPPPKPPSIVAYNGHKVSDPRVREALSNISVYLASSTVTLVSGDRNFVPKGGATRSAHLERKAADIHVVGLSDHHAKSLLEDSRSPVATGLRLIEHGPFTVTEAPHLHLDSRREPKATTDFMIEGTTPANRGVYIHEQHQDQQEKDQQ